MDDENHQINNTYADNENSELGDTSRLIENVVENVFSEESSFFSRTNTSTEILDIAEKRRNSVSIGQLQMNSVLNQNIFGGRSIFPPYNEQQFNNVQQHYIPNQNYPNNVMYNNNINQNYGYQNYVVTPHKSPKSMSQTNINPKLINNLAFTQNSMFNNSPEIKRSNFNSDYNYNQFHQQHFYNQRMNSNTGMNNNNNNNNNNNPIIQNNNSNPNIISYTQFSPCKNEFFNRNEKTISTKYGSSREDSMQNNYKFRKNSEANSNISNNNIKSLYQNLSINNGTNYAFSGKQLHIKSFSNSNFKTPTIKSNSNYSNSILNFKI